MTDEYRPSDEAPSTPERPIENVPLDDGTTDHDMGPTAPPVADFSQFEEAATFQEEEAATAEQFDQPARVSKHTTVMHLKVDNDGEGFVVYEQLPEEGDDGPLEGVLIKKNLQEELGKPLIVTVTVRPGDHLN